MTIMGCTRPPGNSIRVAMRVKSMLISTRIKRLLNLDKNEAILIIPQTHPITKNRKRDVRTATTTAVATNF